MLRDVYNIKNFLNLLKKGLTEFKISLRFESDMKYKWADLNTEDDRYGIKEAIGGNKLHRKLCSDFDLTSPQVWGNIIKGREASGIYGEIIASIRHWGYKEAVGNFTIKTKNRYLRHFVVPD